MDAKAAARPIRRLLVANRAEIASRVLRSARALGIGTVAVHSDADADLPYVREADVAVRLPGTAAADTYLRADRLLEAARRTGCDAVHPGYGFLSERADFVRAVGAAGLTFVGPPADAVERMGSKLAAKELMEDAGVPVLPGAPVAADMDPATLARVADTVGFPLLVKAAFGGGGRGMRVVAGPDTLADAVSGAAREAAAAFGDGTVFLERYVEAPRHVEIQVLADAHGAVVSLFERECSIQRRHQKIVEECPSPAVDDGLRSAMGDAAVRAARAIGYVNAGTVEFVLDGTGRFFFLEVNTRLQVEHPVTELVTGLDLVAQQLRIAQGEPLGDDVRAATIRGHAIEARLYAEAVRDGYRPTSGRLHDLTFPSDPGLRVDAGYCSGSVVSPYYDAMLAKVIAWAPTRAEAAARLAGALRRVRATGVETNRDLLVGVLEHAEFRAGRTDTHFLERHGVDALAPPPTAAAVRAAAVAAALTAVAAARSTSPVPEGIPTGWRNVGPAAQPARFGLVGVPEVTEVTVDVAGSVATGSVRIDDATVPVVVRDCGPLGVDLELDGVRAQHDVVRVGARCEVTTTSGTVVLEAHPRFPLPQEEVAAGSLVAPMPGSVVRLDARAGATVTAGDVLLTLEAMKMEHVVRAPVAGTVTEVRVALGDQVEAGQVLVVVEASA